MFGATAYLRWAMRFYGHVEFDLATSGMTPAPMDLWSGPVHGSTGAALPLGDLHLEDASAWGRLREHIARHNGVPASEALPTLGATHALWTAYASLLAPGDEVLVEHPTYEPIYRIAEGVGARVTRFERSPGERFALDPDRVAAALTPRTRVIALTNLHNPGGVRASDEALRAIGSLAERNGAHVLVDEVYAAFDAMCDARGAWTGSARRLGRNIVVASSLTKVYGLGAHRIGWLLAPSEVIARAEDAHLSNFGHPPVTWSAAAEAAFVSLPTLASRARSLLEGKRARVEAWVAARHHLTWSAPREGLFGFAIDSRGVDLTEGIERSARSSGVLVAPGSFFGFPNAFRLSWSIDAMKLDAGLDRLGEALG
ncbi:MAG: pyridoxal phosphate-dependent aminotransferase [Polyangiaceae bacterium]|jgi:aspartate/methionine/tyrosine aminotransferase